MSAPSLASWIAKKPGLLKMMKPLASWYTNAAGYRQLGLRYARILLLAIGSLVVGEILGEEGS
jgi:hypothetical protein